MDGVVQEQQRRHDEERLHDENHDKQAVIWRSGWLGEAPRDLACARRRRFARILAPAT